MTLNLRVFLFATVVVCGGLTGCKKAAEKESAEPKVMELVNSDLATLRATESPGFEIYDHKSGGNFSDFFGGATRADVVSYLDERSRYYVDPADQDALIAPGWLLRQDWLRTKSDSVSDKSDAKVNATNIGMIAWLASQTGRTSAYFVIRGEKVPIRSSRVGVVMMGEGYVASIKDQWGNRFKVPSFLRQATLVHEARHSDCTGGLARTVIAKIDSGKSEADLERNASGTTCGHLHISCPKKHEYEGLLACDREAWGAYAANELFLRGYRENPELTELDRQIADVAVIDFTSRRQVSRSGKPDMSSGGVVEDY